MKKDYMIIVAVLVLALLMQACSNSYPGLYYDDGGNNNTEYQEELPIKVSLDEHDLFSIAATRGTGAFDHDDERLGTSYYRNKMTNSLFNIFAFRASKDQHGPLTKEVDFSRSLANDESREHCLVDSRNYFMGKPARPTDDGTGELNFIDDETYTKQEELYYSNQYSDVGYNFFGYYLDDFVPTAENTHRETDRIYYDVSIDGAQDMLVGHAPVLTPSVIEERYTSLELTAAECNELAGVGGYSKLAARHDLHPIIDLQHVLTRLRFEAVPGDATADRIRLHQLSVVGKNSGKLVVACNDFTQLGFYPGEETGTFMLREASKDGVTPGRLMNENEDGYIVEFEPDMENIPVMERKTTPFCESLMLVPDTEYQMILEYDHMRRQVDSEGNESYILETRLKGTYDLKAPEETVNYDKATGRYIFKPGYVYTIRIVVYGAQEIEVVTNINAWKFADQLTIETVE